MEHVASPGAKTMIEAQGLTKYYGPFVATENITFSIPEGQIVAFLGPNGAGKTTTMKMLTGLSRSERGLREDRGARRSPGAHRGLEAPRLPAGERTLLPGHDGARAPGVFRRGARDPAR